MEIDHRRDQHEAPQIQGDWRRMSQSVFTFLIVSITCNVFTSIDTARLSLSNFAALH